MLTYNVFGKQVQINPDAKYVTPSDVTIEKLIGGHARFEPFDPKKFLEGIEKLPQEQYGDFFSGLELHLMQYRSLLGFIEATEGDWNAEMIAMDGPVEGPNPLRTEELKDGLRNTIKLFMQLRR